MIAITIDEKACVSCSLCPEICPTGVLAFDEARGVPAVVKPKECFGCLSCSEICPADAIEHDGVTLSESYHHDPYALELAARLATAPCHTVNAPTDPDKRRQALRDLGVRLLSVATVFKHTIGSGLPAVGNLAGRTLAGHLPRYRSPQTLDETLELARAQFAPAWSLAPKREGDDVLSFEVRECFVRDLCHDEGLELGGELCTLFFNYLAGYLGRMGKVRLRLVNAERGWEQCRYQAKLYA